MANIRLFLLLFAGTQTLFVGLDFWELWRLATYPPLSRALRDRKPAILSLAVVWTFYFAIQLGFSAVVPTLQPTLKFLENAFHVSPPSEDPSFASSALALAIGVCTFYVAGFWDYLTHRFLLHSRAAWFLHESHHLPKKVFNGMPGISARPFVAITSFLVNASSIATMFLLFRVINRPGWASLFYRSLPAIIFTFALIGSATHSCFLRRHPLAHRLPRLLFITTPQEHVLHHSAKESGNFGNFTTLWDRFFGTYLEPAMAGSSQCLGLDYDQDFLGAITAGKLKLSTKTRQKWQLSEFCFLEQDDSSRGRSNSSSISESTGSENHF